MVRDTSQSPTDIERLLDERRRVEEWLERLDEKTAGAPELVMSKVRDDYEKRLETVLEQLREYVGELEKALEERKLKRERLAAQQSEAEERLAEAELRHSVGEHSERGWQKIQAEVTTLLEDLGAELQSVDDEIVRLREVVEIARGAPQEAERAARPSKRKRAKKPKATSKKQEEPALFDEEETEAATEEEVAVEEAAAAERQSFDELAFLRSVTEGEEEEPDGPVQTSATPPSKESDEGDLAAASPATAEAEAEEPGDAEGKTHKCKDCGALNFPTEWYCERCGAELAEL